jgi:hypothetical protein
MSGTNNGRTTFVQHLLDIRDAVDRVVEAAVAFYDVTVSPRLATLGEYIGARDTMSNAVRALRAVRGEA